MTIQATMDTDDTIIQRLHFGVVFKQQASFGVILDFWWHSFVIQLPPRPSSEQLRQLTSQITRQTGSADSIPYLFDTRTGGYVYSTFDPCDANMSCSADRPFTTNEEILYRYQNLFRLKEIWDELVYHIPPLPGPRQRLKRSAWSYFLKSINVATNSDVQILFENLKRLNAALNLGSQQLAQTVDQFHTFSRLSSARSQHVDALLRSHHSAMVGINDKLERLKEILINTQHSIANYHHVSIQLSRLHTDLQWLYQGFLPLNLITRHEFSRAITFIKSNLTQRQVPLHVPRHKYSDYMSMRKFTVTRTPDNATPSALIITMQIPLMITQTSFKLFRIYTLPQLVDNVNLHTSMVRDLPAYIGFNPDSPYFLEFNDYPPIQDNNFLLHVNPQVLKSRSVPSCALALLTLDKDDILKYCQFTITPNSARPQILNIAPGQLLLNFVPDYQIQTLGDSPVNHTGCALCLLHIPCESSFTAQHHLWYARVAHCTPEMAASSDISFAVNLPLFERYFNTSELVTDITQLLTEPPLVLLPNVTFHLAESARQLGLIQNVGVDLQFATENALNNTQLFTSVAEQLLNDFQPIDFNEPKVTDIIYIVLQVISPILSVLAIMACAYLYLRLRTITAALTLFSPRVVNAIPTHTIARWYPDRWRTAKPVVASLSITETPNRFVPFNLELTDIDYTESSFQSSLVVLVIIIVLLLIVSCCTKFFTKCFPFFKSCYKCCKTRTTSSLNGQFAHNKLILAVGYGQRMCMIEVLSIPYNISDYQFKAEGFLTKLQITGKIFPKLILEWSQLEIQHRFAQMSLRIPEHITVNWRLARQIHEILSQNHYALFYIQDPSGKLTLMPLLGTTWDTANRVADQPAPISQDPPPLYPVLNTASEVTHL
jgi:hypothetical protein